jgi:hypothetical protein
MLLLGGKHTLKEAQKRDATIIRFSLNDDARSRLRNQLAPILEGIGLRRISTGTYDGDIREADLRLALSQFWQKMAAYTGRAHLDHFWMYTDNPPDDC